MSFKKTIYGFSKFYQHFWWIDVIYPFLLFGVLCFAITFFVYSGQKHRRLSSQIEESLLTFSLQLASPRETLKANRIATVSMTNSDLNTLEHITQNKQSDASLRVYTKLIETLLQRGASYVVIHWQPALHHSELDYKILIAVLKKYKTRIIFSVQPNAVRFIPLEFYEFSDIAEADTCQDGIQVLCIYAQQWTRWIIQILSEDFGTFENVLSTNLPSIFPSYMLHLNSPQDFHDYSFLEILNSQIDFHEKIVFVGNNLVQGRPDFNKSEDVGRVLTAIHHSDDKTRIDGTPLHVFWAQITQMFIDNAIVRVIPFHLSIIFAILFVALITLILFLWGVVPALGFFLILVVPGPFLNAAGIHFFHIYLPLFDFIYAGISTFVALTFIVLSYESLKGWKVSFDQTHAEDIADSKGNFISLISHNLNTPIAKMQGIIDIALTLPFDHESHKQDFIKAHSLTSYIQLCTKIVLVMTALEENKINAEPMNLTLILKELNQNSVRSLDNIGVRVKFSLVHNDLEMIPLHFDKRVLCMFFCAISGLFYNDNSTSNLEFILQVKETLGNPSHDFLSTSLKMGERENDLWHSFEERIVSHNTVDLRLLQTLCLNFIWLAQKHLNVAINFNNKCVELTQTSEIAESEVSAFLMS